MLVGVKQLLVVGCAQLVLASDSGGDNDGEPDRGSEKSFSTDRSVNSSDKIPSVSTKSSAHDGRDADAFESSSTNTKQDKMLLKACKDGNDNVKKVKKLLVGGGKQGKGKHKKKSSGPACADINTVGPNGETPLVLASLHNNPTIVNELLSCEGILVNYRCADGAGTALHAACFGGYNEVVELLVKHKDIDVNCHNTVGATPLFAACAQGRDLVVQTLVGHPKTNVNKATNEGVSPLMTAAMEGHLSVVRILVQRDDLDVNQANRRGCTAFGFARSKGHLEIVHELLAHPKIDAELANRDGLTPMQAAESNDHHDIVNLLRKHLE